MRIFCYATSPSHPPKQNFDQADGKAPKLKLKAAEGRYMLKVMTWVVETFHPPATEHARLRFQALQSLSQMYEELMQFSNASVVRVQVLAREHMACYEELSRTAENDLFFKIYPKHHLFTHWVDELPNWGRIQDSWCYMDESALGELVEICPGLHVSNLHRSLLQKIRI